MLTAVPASSGTDNNDDGDDDSNNNNMPHVIQLCDRSLLPAEADVRRNEFSHHIVFYLYTVCAAELNSAFSCRMLQVMHSGVRAAPFVPASRMKRKLVSSLPIAFRGGHIARAYQHGREAFLDFQVYGHKRLQETNFGIPFDCTAENSSRATLDKLIERGFPRHVLPRVLGGAYCHSQFFDSFVRKRLTVENSMDAAPPVRNAEVATQAAATTILNHLLGQDNSHQHGAKTVPAKKIERLPGESDAAFLKRRNAIKSKRLYDKKRFQQDSLRKALTMLESEQAALQAENLRLQVSFLLLEIN